MCAVGVVRGGGTKERSPGMRAGLVSGAETEEDDPLVAEVTVVVTGVLLVPGWAGGPASAVSPLAGQMVCLRKLDPFLSSCVSRLTAAAFVIVSSLAL